MGSIILVLSKADALYSESNISIYSLEETNSFQKVVIFPHETVLIHVRLNYEFQSKHVLNTHEAKEKEKCFPCFMFFCLREHKY